MSLKRQLFRYIVPNSLATIGMCCYILADTFFISVSAGANGITALNLILPIFSFIFALGSMLGNGSAILYALHLKADPKGSKGMFSDAIVWCVVLGLLFLALGLLCPRGILRLMGADPVILAVGTPYLRIILLFSPFFLLNFTFTAFVRNDYAPKLAMAATLFSSFFNIFCDWLLIFVLDLGMTGAALATAVSPIVSTLICLLHFRSPKNHLTFRLALPSPGRLVRACQLGAAYFLGEFATGITTVVFNFTLLNLAGNVSVAAYGVIANTAVVANALFNGIAQGQQPLLSQLRAQGNEAGEREVSRCSQVTASCVAVVIALVTLLFAKPLVAVFNSEHSQVLASYAEPGMRIYFLGFLFAGVNIVQAGCFGAVGAARESFLIAACRGIVASILFVLLLPQIFGIVGVWLSFPAAELLTLFLAFLLTRRSRARAGRSQ